MKHLSLFSLLAMSALMISCDNGDNDKMEVIANFNQFYTVTSSSSNSHCANATFTYEIDYTDGTIDIIANNVSFSSRMPAITMEIDDIPFKYTNSEAYSSSGISFSATNIVPEVGGQEMRDYTITSINGEIGYIESAQANTAMLTMVVNNQYTIAVQPATPVFEYYNSSVVSSSTTYTNSNAIFQLVYDPTNKLVDIYIHNAQFASAMPAMNMVFKAIPFESAVYGVDFSIDELTPYLVGSTGATTPAPNYVISNLSGRVVSGKLDFDFTCTITAQNNSATGASYNVTNAASLFTTIK